MIRAPLTYRKLPWSKEKLARIREIERDFHVRAFGEELASVNLDMSIAERHRYLADMRELGWKHGVPPTRHAFRIEEEDLDLESPQ